MIARVPLEDNRVSSHISEEYIDKTKKAPYLMA